MSKKQNKQRPAVLLVCCDENQADLSLWYLKGRVLKLPFFDKDLRIRTVVLLLFVCRSRDKSFKMCFGIGIFEIEL